jgi:hypothetical protein
MAIKRCPRSYLETGARIIGALIYSKPPAPFRGETERVEPLLKIRCLELLGDLAVEPLGHNGLCAFLLAGALRGSGPTSDMHQKS